jgi:peptide chain release factor subunit 1
VDRDPPPPAREAAVEVERVDPEHPKRSLPPATLSATPLDEAVARLTHLDPSDLPVVSVYWSVPDDLGRLKGAKSKLHDLAKRVRERAEDPSATHAERVSLRADANRILELEDLVPVLQGRAVGFFRCDRRGLEEAVLLPNRVRDRVDIGPTPFIRPLLAVLDEAHRYAVVIVDRERGRLFEFHLGQLEAMEREDGRALRDPNFAQGDKEHGVHNKARELAKRHYRQTADALEELATAHDIELVVVCGHTDTVPAFIEQLPHQLRPKVIGTCVVDPRTTTPGMTREEVERVVEDYERREEERLVARALDRVASGGAAAARLDWCLLAANELAIELLLVGGDASAPGRVCRRCGWLGLDGVECPVDGKPTDGTDDVIDDMAARVFESSGHVKHVYADTPLREHQVAALLRFPVPPP